MAIEDYPPIEQPRGDVTPEDVDDIATIIVGHLDPNVYIERVSGRLPGNLYAAFHELQEQMAVFSNGNPRAVREVSLGYLFAHNVVKLCVPEYEEPELSSTELCGRVHHAMVLYRSSGAKPLYFPEVEGLLAPYPGVYDRLIRHHLASKPGKLGAQVLLQCVSTSLNK